MCHDAFILVYIASTISINDSTKGQQLYTTEQQTAAISTLKRKYTILGGYIIMERVSDFITFSMLGRNPKIDVTF